MRRRDWLKTVLGSGALAVGGLSIPPTPHLNSTSLVSRTHPNTSRALGADELVTDETKAAIKKGLRFLQNRQIKSGENQGAFGTSGYAAGTAVAALAGLAFMCAGSTPVDGPHESNIRHSTGFLLRHTSDRGYIAAPGNQSSNMYGHGYAMLFLSQVYGMAATSAVEEKLKLAIDMTCNVQNDQGGWRYQPQKQQGDLSITICQIMALRAAHDAGMHVSKEVRDKTVEYVNKCQKDDGSYQYLLRGGRVSVALTAAGVVSLYSAGIYEGENIEKALKWIFDHKPSGTSSRTLSPMNYYYAHYYAVQAMWHAQFKHPDYWNEWYTAVRDELLAKSIDGVWDDQRVCKEFATAMACIILQIPFNYVPVFTP